MHHSRRARTRSAARSWLPIAIVVVTTGLGGLPAWAGPADKAPAPGTRATAEPACAPAGPGRATCFALRRTDLAANRDPRARAAAPAGYGPADLRAAYGLPDNGGAGATIAVVAAYDNPNAEADLATYRARYGLPPCTTADGCFRKIDQRGGTGYPRTDQGWAGEISLDLDLVSAVAPLARLLLVEADTARIADMGAAVDQAVSSGARYVSNSYGTEEDATLLGRYGAHYDHPGVAVVAASGDGGLGVSFPASSRHVTAVGGTSLSRDDSGRGWSESVWHDEGGGTGGGCSGYEPKPAFQTDAGCGYRMVADVAAVADPATGVAVYDSFGPAGGWGVYGGTSAAAPIITGVYAVAGTPAEGTYPNSYPYTRRSALHDITSGHNGGCQPTYLCTAQPGYDGPTGLGTPNGTTAFHAGPYGTLTGTITDSAGEPVPAVTVRAGVADTITGADGRYTLHLPPGTVDVTAALLGYRSASDTGGIADHGTTTVDFALTALPRVRVSGTVTDGSGHGWPLYARITVAGMPGATFTDPVTGRYQLDMPSNQTHRLRVTPLYEGYQPVQVTVAVASSPVSVEPIALPVDQTACTASGYHDQLTGGTEAFDNPTPPTGWTVLNNAGNGGWRFDDPRQRGNETGGSGGFAVVTSDGTDPERPIDVALLPPAIDFSATPTPLISFDTYFSSSNYRIEHADVELSLDGGASWATLWQRGAYQPVYGGHIELFVPQAAGRAGVLVRFHFVADHDEHGWQLDNVFIGNHGCEPSPGGLVTGRVTDANSGAGVTGALVSTPDGGGARTTSTATPDDPALGDGFYTLYTADAGQRRLTASGHHRTPATTSVTSTADRTTRADLALRAGRIAVTGPARIEQTVAWGSTGSTAITVTNTGTAPATVSTGEQPGGSVPLLLTGAATGALAATTTSTTARITTGVPADTATGIPARTTAGVPVAAATGNAAGTTAWAPIADLPADVYDNIAAVHDGRLYAGFGTVLAEPTARLYVYDPGTSAWSELASAHNARSGPAAAFLDGKLYVVGGGRSDQSVDPTMEVYDPATGAWSFAAPNPMPRSHPGVAVVDGRLFLVGGCSIYTCRNQEVQVYDPETNAWATVAPYPRPIASQACGAIRGRLYCAGGVVDIAGGGEDTYTAATYAYDPASDTWAPRAAMPASVGRAASAAANGLLLVAGGYTGEYDYPGNRVFGYDPATDTWARLPDLSGPASGAAGACGFYRVGGNGATAEVLPGYGGCGDTGGWLATSANRITLQPGASATLTVTLDPTATGVAQPGAYTTRLIVDADTPYPATALPVTMTVQPPPAWGRLTGKVTAATDGTPIHGATVQIETRVASYTLTTNAKGEYAIWLDAGGGPAQIIVARERYQPQARTVAFTAANTTIASFALKPRPAR